jgi:hypothetical protein
MSAKRHRGRRKHRARAASGRAKAVAPQATPTRSGTAIAGRDADAGRTYDDRASGWLPKSREWVGEDRSGNIALGTTWRKRQRPDRASARRASAARTDVLWPGPSKVWTALLRPASEPGGLAAGRAVGRRRRTSGRAETACPRGAAAADLIVFNPSRVPSHRMAARRSRGHWQRSCHGGGCAGTATPGIPPGVIKASTLSSRAGDCVQWLPANRLMPA